MNSKILLIVLTLFSISTLGQISDFKQKFELPSQVEETSGLLFFNSKIITHNDSGDTANLYEIDSLSGSLLRTININNATHIDWEDITEDENHIYIGDFGNNDGERTDLKIYKILKSDYLNNNSVSAEIISFSYEDQTDFSSSNTHNFDAEAFVVYNDSFFIFTKNRGDFKTNVYKIPTTIGNHSAVKVSTANVEGLITGVTLQNNNFMLCGYDTNAVPFLVYISFNRNTGDDIFNNGFSKYSLINELGVGSQVEGITRFDNGRFYISREEVNKSSINLKQALFEFKDDRDFLLSTDKNELESLRISPNPTFGKIFINNKNTIEKISIFNTLGKKILEINTDNKEIDISTFSKGIYLLKIQFDNQKTINRKVIKL